MNENIQPPNLIQPVMIFRPELHGEPDLCSLRGERERSAVRMVMKDGEEVWEEEKKTMLLRLLRGAAAFFGAEDAASEQKHETYGGTKINQ